MLRVTQTAMSVASTTAAASSAIIRTMNRLATSRVVGPNFGLL